MPVRPIHAVRLLTALALPAFLAACGGDGADEAPPPPDATATAPAASGAPAAGTGVDPCALMEPGEVQAAAGVEATAGSPSTSGGANVCTWTDAAGRSAIVQVHPTAEWYDRSRAAFEGQYGGTADDAPGIGDAAYVITGSTGPIPTATVGVRRGGTSVAAQVMAMGADAETLRSHALELAQRVAQKL